MSHIDPEPRPDWRARFAALRNIPPFLALVWRADPRLTLAALGLRTLGALVPVTVLWLAKLILDEVVRLSALTDAPTTLIGWWQSGLATPLATLIAAEFAVGIASDLIQRLTRLTDSLLAERLTIDLSIRIMDHAATLDLTDFEDATFQDKLDRARRQAMGRMSLLGTIFGQLQEVLTLATLGAGLILYNPWLLVLLATALVPAFLAEAHFNARGYDLDRQRTADRRQGDYLRMIAASTETAKEVKIFDLHRFLGDRYLTIARQYYAGLRAIAVARAAWGALFSAIGTLAYYGAYAWIVGRTLTGDLSVGDMTFLAGSFLRLRGIIESLLTGFSTTAAQALYLQDLFDFFRTVPRIASRPGAVPVPDPIRHGFAFEGVGFRYPGSDLWAVRDLTFTLRAGETLALVGENGAGKTTLVKLLARLYDPDEGRITLDGTDLRDLDLTSLRAAVGVIFQDFVRYSMSAADNIAVGRIDARTDRPRIVAAADQAMAAPVIERLPRAYDQMIGRRFWGGMDLSGGEWQKIAIARAYMRGAQVLILDEPTAALDARAETEVFARFKALSAGRSAVLISHRFSSVRMADRILVLHRGRIEDSGTHEELIARTGRYADLFEMQARGYR